MILEIFAESFGESFRFCDGTVAMVSVLPDFTADETAMQTHYLEFSDTNGNTFGGFTRVERDGRFGILLSHREEFLNNKRSFGEYLWDGDEVEVRTVGQFEKSPFLAVSTRGFSIQILTRTIAMGTS
jgi:hypothetical protein